MYDYLDLIDTNTGGPRCDVTPLFANPTAFAQLIHDLSAPFDESQIDYVAGIDALGFVLASAIAYTLKKGFIPIRKAGKLPGKVVAKTFVDYTGETKALELRCGLVRGGRILLVDEWIETGAQISAAVDLLEGEGGIILGITTINIDHNPNTARIQKQYHCHALWYGE